MKIYSADFETNNAQKNIEYDYTNVWAYDICTVNNNVFLHYTGKNIHDFIKNCLDLGGGIFYFHNLKFDGQFILHYLLRNNYKFSTEKKLNVGEFYSLITERGVYYMIKACIGYHNSRRVIVEFRDSSKKIVGSVEKIAQDYNLPIKKGSIDYTIEHSGHRELTVEEIEYIRNDTEIIARVLQEQYLNDMTKLTYSSDSLNKYKECLHGNYRRFFPVVDYDTDCFFRDSYRGGVVMINPMYEGCVITQHVYCYDINSGYPYIMCTKCLPYGEPVAFFGLPRPNNKYPLFIVEVKVCFDLKKGHYPTLLRKSLGFKKIEYMTSTNGEIETLVLNSVDLELLLEHYNIHEIEYTHGYYFQGSTKLFAKYLQPIYEAKSNSEGAIRELNKLLMNGLSGKFGTNPKHVQRIPHLVDGKIQFSNGDITIEEPEYTPVISFVTAYLRRMLYSVIHNHRDTFVYSDTDSIHSLEEIHDIDIDKKRMGAWDLEKVYIKSKYLAQKTYMGQKKNGQLDIKICGAPQSVKKYVNFDNFRIGATYGGKLLSRRVRGGVVLKDSTFTIKKR